MQVIKKRKLQSETKNSVAQQLKLNFLSPMELFVSDWLLYDNDCSERDDLFFGHYMCYQTEVSPKQKNQLATKNGVGIEKNNWQLQSQSKT